MIEDKLTHDERVRLECIAQANQTVAPTLMRERPGSPISGAVLDIARKYEEFVRGPAVES